MAFTKKAQGDLRRIQKTIALAAAPTVAEKYVARIAELCATLRTFPYRGASRAELHGPLRVIGYKDRVSIAYGIQETSKLVTIARIRYAGQLK